MVSVPEPHRYVEHSVAWGCSTRLGLLFCLLWGSKCGPTLGTSGPGPRFHVRLGFRVKEA